MGETIHEWELREALEEAAAVNHGPNGERFDVDAAIAHWRATVGTSDAIAPNDNDGYATRLVDQIAVGYVLADGPWWKADDAER